jgi:3-isopropylmalate/(R)-2-methylmalate dehydratase large subunit
VLPESAKVSNPRSIIEKLWDSHIVRAETQSTPAVMYIDLHLVHEVTSPQGFDLLRERHLPVRQPGRTLATLDHSTPTLPADASGQRPYVTAQAREQVAALRQNCADFGVELHDWDSAYRGIVHVMGPEMGATQPGMTIVCGDSHTSTHGAFGALAFGIGSTEVGYVLATQCVLQRQPKTMRITLDGELGESVSAKDLVLHLIGVIGVNGGTGHVIEFAGSAIRALDMEGRMTVCNMSIEAGAKAGVIAPDATTVDYLRGRVRVPSGAAFEPAAEKWLQLASDPGAVFDRELHIDAAEIVPTVTYGTDPGMVVRIDGLVPGSRNDTAQRALDYMAVEAGKPMLGRKVDLVFIGSCTNGRLSDMRVAAAVLEGHKIAAGVRMLVVPGSEQVRRQAEAEGLHLIFEAAGAEWRLPGCSMCLAMNGDIVPPGKIVVTTSNRNFEGRQGAGARSILASPATAAASAVAGCVADPRQLSPQREVA